MGQKVVSVPVNPAETDLLKADVFGGSRFRVRGNTFHVRGWTGIPPVLGDVWMRLKLPISNQISRAQ